MTEAFRRPSWHEAAIWMGMSFPGFVRLMRGRTRQIDPAYLVDAVIDAGFAGGNSAATLVSRLLFEREHFRRPADRPPLQTNPVFILGHWRTGTTLLHELMSLDPALRFSNAYECFLPHHFPLSERWIKPWSSFALPSKRPPDNMQVGWDLPQEDEFALVNLGLPSPYLTIAFPNQGLAHSDYFELEKIPAADLEHWKLVFSDFLRRLVAYRPGRLVLKSPPHSFRIPTLQSLFPEACFIYLIRNPREVYASTVHLWRSLFHTHGYQKPDESWISEFVLDTFARLCRRVEATRGMVAEGRFLVVRYEEFVADPLATLRTIYDRFGIGDFGAIESTITANLTSRKNYQKNRFQLGEAEQAAIAERWGEFFKLFGYVI